ncbi:hypothetical protein D9758_018033 [Tetrapyrgos nigripes]|uniref:TPR-like protein n=1 Tax=Tetrapyrgos nigripes TaxID=182062 RepID=A0A8H5FJ37_9AGAR|nr:hypothetical protein D9758_018033 [Tetrapyrgos nigripes]
MQNLLIKEKFAERCYFISCGMLPDAINLIQELVQAIGLQVAQGKGPLDVLLAYLKGGQKVMLILDNFETPWNSKGQTEVKNLMEDICSAKSVSVIVTMRGTDGPGQIKWHKLGGQSGLPALELSAAKEAFCSFSSNGEYTIKEEDPILEKLLIQMDGMPLAIMLIGELAKELPLNDLMEMWNIQKAAVLKKIGEQDNRLASIEVSIQLTLNVLGEKLSATGEDVLVFQGTEHLEDQIWKFYESLIDNLPQDSIARNNQLEQHIGNIFKILEIQIKRSFEKSHMKVLIKLCNYTKYYPGLLPLVEKHLEWKSQMILSDQIEMMFLQESILSFMGEYGKAIEVINCVEELYKSQINEEAGNLNVITSTSSISMNNTIEQTQAKCYRRLGTIFFYQCDYTQSQQKLQQARELYESIGDMRGVAECLQSLGNICRMLSQHENAKVMLEQAKQQFEGVGYRLGAADCLQSLGDICKMLAQYEDAKVMLQQAKEIFEGVGHILGFAQCLQSLGDICMMLSQHEDAKMVLQQAKEQLEKVGSMLGAAQCLQSLGNICQTLNEYDDAKVLYQQAKEKFECIGARQNAAQCLQSLGDIYLKLSQPEDAKVMFQQAQEQFEGINDRLGTGQCLFSLAIVFHSQGYLNQAKAEGEKAKDHFEAIQMPQQVADCVVMLQQLNEALAVAVEAQAE